MGREARFRVLENGTQGMKKNDCEAGLDAFSERQRTPAGVGPGEAFGNGDVAAEVAGGEEQAFAVRVDGNAPDGMGRGDFDINLWADCAGAVSMVAIPRRRGGAQRGRVDAAAVAKAETFANSLGARSSFWRSLRRATVC